MQLFLQDKKSDLDISILKVETTKYFTVKSDTSRVFIDGEWIFIKLNTETIANQRSDYNKAISFCEKGKYKGAKPVNYQKRITQRQKIIYEAHFKSVTEWRILSCRGIGLRKYLIEFKSKKSKIR